MSFEKNTIRFFLPNIFSSDIIWVFFIFTFVTLLSYHFLGINIPFPNALRCFLLTIFAIYIFVLASCLYLQYLYLHISKIIQQYIFFIYFKNDPTLFMKKTVNLKNIQFRGKYL